jgi:hypothetical protein
VSGIATTPAAAATLANDGIVALGQYVAQQQEDQGVPPAARATLQTLNNALPYQAQVFTPRSKTPPVVVFILVMAATIGLVFVLENLRPRVRPVPVEVPRSGGEQQQQARRLS